MKILMLTAVTGPDLYLACGAEYDVDETRGDELVEVGYARPVAATLAAKREKATAPPLETR